MPANMRKIMGEVPRPFEIQAHDDQDQIPMGRQKLPRSETTQRTQSYLNQVVSGQIPLDEQSAEVIREYLDAHHARQ